MRQKTKQTMAKDESKEDEDNNEDDDDEGIDEQQSSSSISLSTAQCFHNDGLHSIFRLLTMSELNHAIQTCKQWLNAASHPSFRLPSTVDVQVKSANVPALIDSRLCSLISNLTVTDTERLTSINDLSSLHALQHLGDFDVSIDIHTMKRTPRQSIVLPPGLNKLHIAVKGVTHGPLCPSDAVVRGMQQLLINAIAAVPTLTSLKLHLSEREVELDYTPLINLVNLQDLSISLASSRAAAAMNTIKQLPMLRSLRIETSNSRDSHLGCILRSLCSSPTPTKLETLCMDELVTADDMAVLAQLPSLTGLIAEIDEGAASHLPRLTQLNLLNIERQCDAFLPFIPQLQYLTDLRLFSCSLSDEHAAHIMTSCRHLTSLVLDCVWVESLDWLNSVEGSSTSTSTSRSASGCGSGSGLGLTALEVRSCGGIYAEDLTSIYALKSLQRLTLRASCRLDDSTLHALTPPSTPLPNLTSFDYASCEEE